VAEQKPITFELVEKAARAPSSHNTQPWLFAVGDDHITLYADRTRALPVNDPFDRELTISCGAALYNLEAAAAEAGYGTETTFRTDGRDPDELATVALTAREPDPERARLAGQIGRRRSTREPFDGRPAPPELPEALQQLAAVHGCWLEIVEDPARRVEIASLVAEGDRVQFADPRWRRELASWMHPRRKGDGLTMPELVAPVSRLVVSAFDLGKSTAGKDEDLATKAPLLAVLGTEADEPRAWLQAGRALEAILLRAAEDDLQSGYLNQPCQVPALRPQLQQAIGHLGFPQVLLRFGHGEPPRQLSPRRPLEAVLVD
jgi:hypothetical protein